MIWKYLSAGVLILTALAHSLGGFRTVLAPMLKGTTPTPVSDENATLLSVTWHGMAALMILSAVTIAWPETPRSLIILSGIFWLGFALVDIITSKFAHPGWIPMGIAGVLALIGAYR